MGIITTSKRKGRRITKYNEKERKYLKKWEKYKKMKKNKNKEWLKVRKGQKTYLKKLNIVFII